MHTKIVLFIQSYIILWLQLIKALLDYDKAIEYEPEYAESYINRAILLKAMGRIGEAREDYAKAIELKPDLRGVMEV